MHCSTTDRPGVGSLKKGLWSAAVEQGLRGAPRGAVTGVLTAPRDSRKRLQDDAIGQGRRDVGMVMRWADLNDVDGEEDTLAFVHRDGEGFGQALLEPANADLGHLIGAHSLAGHPVQGLRRRTVAPVYSLVVATEHLPQSLWDEIGLADAETFSDHRHVVVYGQRSMDDRIVFGGRGAPYHFGSRIRPEFDQHRSRRWEPEPLRWLGVNAGLRLATLADREERLTGRPAVLGRALSALTSH